MKVLVTGASGNVGKYVVQELLNLGEEVVVAGTNPKKLEILFKGNNIETVYLDFTDKFSYKNALYNVDRVYLLRPPHMGKPRDLYPFIDAMKSNNIKLVVFLSLMGIEKNTIPPHYKIEKYIEEKGIPYAHVRPSFFMQNISGIHSIEVRELDMIFIPAGNSKTSFIDARDIGLSVAVLLHNPMKYKNTTHTITGSDALSYYQVAEIFSNVTGREIVYGKPGYLKYRSYYIKNRGLDNRYVNVTVALYFMTRMGTAKTVTDEFYHLTGKKPRSIEEFIKDNYYAFDKET